MNIIVDESKVMEALVQIERAKVLANSLLNSYFDQKIETRDDLWKIGGAYYESGRIFTEIILNFAHDAKENLDAVLDEASVQK